LHGDSGTHRTADEHARNAAAALLEAGDIRRAADTYRDAGLDDEAIHLYVNVLGLPGEAAPLVAASGDPRRAAELYEMAGHDIRAAATWCVVAQASAHPEQFIDRIERLDHHMAVEMLEEETEARPLSPDTAELYYRYARLLESDSEHQAAVAIYRRICEGVGDHKDARARAQGTGKVAASSSDQLFLPPLLVPPSDEDSAPNQALSGNPRDTLSDIELKTLANELAKTAAAQLQPVDPLAQIMATANMARASHIQSSEIAIVGFEQGSLDLSLLDDDAVEAARFGPSIEALHDYIGDRPCDLQNIEVYYRLGLAHLAQGSWLLAIEAFDAVEEGSPGYRDADRRANEIRAWRDALGERISGFAVGDTSSSRYAIRGELGRGAMAVVYRAIDTSTDREVALKLLAEGLASDGDARRRFQREARAIAKLNHPNIVRLHEVGEVDGRSFMSMEYVRGKTVDMLIADGQSLSIIGSLRVAEQMLDALAYAHDLGIVHRDIKPGNMMQTASGVVKLMDFGLSADTNTAEGGIVAGSPAYMPPEQLDGLPVDHRGDIFALGVTLYEMLTGRLPFDAFDRSREPRPVSARVGAVPGVLDRIIAHALELDPDQRYRRAGDMLRDIRAILSAVNGYTR
jgi:tetratricopeptide (TPR) repeat protein